MMIRAVILVVIVAVVVVVATLASDSSEARCSRHWPVVIGDAPPQPLQRVNCTYFM